MEQTLILGGDTNEKAKKEIHCSGSGIYIGYVCVNRRYICSRRESGTAEQYNGSVVKTKI